MNNAFMEIRAEKNLKVFIHSENQLFTLIWTKKPVVRKSEGWYEVSV